MFFIRLLMGSILGVTLLTIAGIWVYEHNMPGCESQHLKIYPLAVAYPGIILPMTVPSKVHSVKSARKRVTRQRLVLRHNVINASRSAIPTTIAKSGPYVESVMQMTMVGVIVSIIHMINAP